MLRGLPRIDGVLASAFLLAAGCSKPTASPAAHAPTTEASAPRVTPSKPAEPDVVSAERALEASQYAEAEAHFRASLSAQADTRARLGLARVLMLTGRHSEAQTLLEAGLGNAESPDLDLATLLAESLHQSGASDEAITLCKKLEPRPEARRARWLLGELLLERGNRKAAEEVLMTLIEDYNSDRIGPDDGAGLALVGRAAHLLRSPHDANDAFNAAERAAPDRQETLLWRAQLFLEKHDPGHAEEVVSELLEKAPNHPQGLVWMAHVKLEQSLDFDGARDLAERALAINPAFTHAYYVLAGLELRDLEFETALGLIDRGLAKNPEDLELASLRAATLFLSEDQTGFESARKKIFAQNPRYSRFYSIVGEFAEWEHRYDRIVEMMREAVAIDDDDSEAHAALGLNLIRAGQESSGVQSLRRAIAKDPFNVRVFNTLNLFETIIPDGYVSRPAGRFAVRYPKGEAALLERYVPPLLERAFAKFSSAYGFVPSQPIGIELYAEREHFAVRTSGLPQTSIQGVCFGKTLASLTPHEEPFNLGMTLWHELAHVFHIQMSESHVPRWLTEGLAEYETLVERVEWRRHHDPDLFVAHRARRLPRVAGMNRAFSHAEQMQDMATAYYASSQIVVMLVERYGRDAVNRVLRLHGQGMSTEKALSQGLGASSDVLDREFDDYLNKSLSRYRQQFVPLDVRGNLSELIAQADALPGDVTARLRVVLAALREKQLPLAKSALDKARKLDPGSPDVRFIGARLAAMEDKDERAIAELEQLARAGHDGYAVQMSLASLSDPKKKPQAVRGALVRAHELDPTQAEPLTQLLQLSREAKDQAEEIRVLELLARLEEHDPTIYRRLLELLVATKANARAVEVGQAAIFADLEGASTHVLYAKALAAEGRLDDATFEFESATLCPGRPAEVAEAHLDYAEFARARGQTARAAALVARARELDPENARLSAGTRR